MVVVALLMLMFIFLVLSQTVPLNSIPKEKEKKKATARGTRCVFVCWFCHATQPSVHVTRNGRSLSRSVVSNYISLIPLHDYKMCVLCEWFGLPKIYYFIHIKYINIRTDTHRHLYIFYIHVKTLSLLLCSYKNKSDFGNCCHILCARVRKIRCELE